MAGRVSIDIEARHCFNDRLRVGRKLGFLKTTVESALKNHEFGAEFRSYMRFLNLHEF